MAGSNNELKMEDEMGIYQCKDLKVYNRSFEIANKVYEISKKFPVEEKYSLVDQIRRSARSVPANIREGFAKRKYKDIFKRHLNDALGSAEETQTWLDFAHSGNYISDDVHNILTKEYLEITSMIYALMKNWNDFGSDRR